MSDYGDHQHTCNVHKLLVQLPKDERGIGEEVLHAISCGKKLLSWNGKQQLVIDGRAIPNTNIIELVQYVLYPEGEVDANPPTGLKSFVEELQRIGLESQWVRNASVIDALDNNDHEWDTTDSESSASDEEDESDMEQSSGEEDNANFAAGSTTIIMPTDSGDGQSIKWKNISSDDE